MKVPEIISKNSIAEQMELHHFNSENYIYPDFGIFFVENFGKDTVFHSPSIVMFSISYITENLYSSTSNLEYDGVKYCVSLDFDSALFEQILNEINNKELKERLAKVLKKKFTEPSLVDIKDKPIELMISAIPGKRESNNDEEYIPFIAEDFSFININTRYSSKNLIPEKITHVMMKEDFPVGFAIKYGKQDEDEPNLLNAYVCYPGMAKFCEHGSVYQFNNLEEAEKSFAWQLTGGFNNAVLIDNLTYEQFEIAKQLWLKYEEDFIFGFSKNEIVFEDIHPEKKISEDVRKVIFNTEEFSKLTKIVEEYTQLSPIQKNPQAKLVIGPMASGKTTIIKENYSTFVYIDFDDVSIKVIDIFSNPEKEKFADLTMFCLNQIIDSSIRSQKNIAIELMGNDKERLDIIIFQLKKIGYEVELIIIQCDINEGMRRQLERSSSGEFYPTSYYSEEITIECLLSYLKKK